MSAPIAIVRFREKCSGLQASKRGATYSGTNFFHTAVVFCNQFLWHFWSRGDIIPNVPSSLKPAGRPAKLATGRSVGRAGQPGGPGGLAGPASQAGQTQNSMPDTRNTMHVTPATAPFATSSQNFSFATHNSTPATQKLTVRLKMELPLRPGDESYSWGCGTGPTVR